MQNIKRNLFSLLIIIAAILGAACIVHAYNTSELKLEIIAPGDRMLVYQDRVLVTGIASGTLIQKSFINGEEVEMNAYKVFNKVVMLNNGKNAVLVEAKGSNDKLLAKDKIRLLRLRSFLDVPGDHWARDAIEQLAALGIVGGYPNGKFLPEQKVTRAEIAKLMVNLKGIPIEPGIGQPIFYDLTANHWAAVYINTVAKKRFMYGYPGGKFAPWKALTRAEAVATIAKFDGLSEPLSISSPPFPDLLKRHWAAGIVTVAKKAGLLDYLAGRDFEPDKVLTRAEAAWMLSRTSHGRSKINDLMDFNKGY